MGFLKANFPVVAGFVLGALVGCGPAISDWVAPSSWTIRQDGHIRASQRKEDFTAEQFIAKIKAEENKDYGLCLTPAGEAEISRELARRAAKILELQNQLSNCK